MKNLKMLTFNFKKYNLNHNGSMLDVGCGEGRHIFGIMQEYPMMIYSLKVQLIVMARQGHLQCQQGHHKVEKLYFRVP